MLITMTYRYSNFRHFNHNFLDIKISINRIVMWFKIVLSFCSLRHLILCARGASLFLCFFYIIVIGCSIIYITGLLRVGALHNNHLFILLLLIIISLRYTFGGLFLDLARMTAWFRSLMGYVIRGNTRLVVVSN